jgi:hypothetical protein
MRYITALATLPLALAAPLAERDGPSKYIVVLKSDAPAPQSGPSEASITGTAGTTVASIPKDLIYDQQGFKGFSASLTSDQITALKQDSTVSILLFFYTVIFINSL